MARIVDASVSHEAAWDAYQVNVGWAGWIALSNSRWDQDG
jgi:hypothetical protein